MSGWNLRQRWRTWRRRWAAKVMQEEVGIHIMGLGGASPGGPGTRRAWSEAELSAWFEQRMQPLLEVQTQSNHKRSLTQLAVQMLIVSHPDPELLLRNWNVNLPNVIDEIHAQFPQDDPQLRALALQTWQEELACITGLIERTVQAREEAEAREGTATGGPRLADQALVRLVADSQHLNGIVFLVKMLIATHAEIARLKQTWEVNVTQASDRIIDAPAPFGQPALKQVMLDAYRMTIEDFTRDIDEALRLHREQQDDEDP